MKSLFPSPSARWPFYLADAAWLGLAASLVAHARGPLDWRAALGVVACVAAGAYLALIPHVGRFGRGGSGVETEDSLFTDVAPTAGNGHDANLVEIALLAWRIQKRAEKQPEPSRPLLRNAEKILELLTRLDLEVISYAGRKLDIGSKVKVLEWADGEENRVLEEHEPQIQIRGRLVHQSLVTAGKGFEKSSGPSPALQP